MNKFIQLVIKIFLKRNIEIDKNIPFFYLLGVLYERLFMLIRGLLYGFFFKKRNFSFFVGKKVVLKCKKLISVSKSVTFQDYVYIDALSKLGVNFGRDVSIGKRTFIKTSGSLSRIGVGFSIGFNSCLGNDCYVGASGGVEIGNNVAVGPLVYFHSENHGFDRKDILISEQGVTNKGIKIGNDCWIGSGCVFLDGVVIGNGVVIGANTVVNKNIPDYAVAVGNPVRIIKYRT